MNVSAQVTGDTAQVNKLNHDGYAIRRSDAQQTIAKGTKALQIARQIDYQNGIAESYRMIGVGRDYNGEPEKAIDNYLNALSFFQSTKNLSGQAKVYNNIGNLYRDNDYDKALEYLRQALKIAVEIRDTSLMPSLYLNIGNVYMRQKDFYKALNEYAKSQLLFTQLGIKDYDVSIMQNMGVAYFNLGQYDKAEKLLLASNEGAKKTSKTQQIASIDLTLSSLYIAKKNFTEAEKFVDEGISYSEINKSKRLLADFKYTSYQLEVKRKNFEKALHYLQGIYASDSTDFQNYVSARIKTIADKA